MINEIMFVLWLLAGFLMVATIEFKSWKRKKTLEAQYKIWGERLKEAVANAKSEEEKNRILYYALVDTRIQLYL